MSFSQFHFQILKRQDKNHLLLHEHTHTLTQECICMHHKAQLQSTKLIFNLYCEAPGLDVEDYLITLNKTQQARERKLSMCLCVCERQRKRELACSCVCVCACARELYILNFSVQKSYLHKCVSCLTAALL